MRKISTLLLSLLLLSIGWLSLHAQKNTTLLFDFETESSGWQAGTPPNFGDSSAKAVKLSTKNASQGKQAIELIFEKNDMPKAVFFVEAPTDLSTESHLLFDLYGSDATSGVALALSTGSSWEWHESGVVPVKPGNRPSPLTSQPAPSKSQASVGVDDCNQKSGQHATYCARRFSGQNRLDLHRQHQAHLRCCIRCFNSQPNHDKANTNSHAQAQSSQASFSQNACPSQQPNPSHAMGGWRCRSNRSGGGQSI